MIRISLKEEMVEHQGTKELLLSNRFVYQLFIFLMSTLTTGLANPAGIGSWYEASMNDDARRIL